MKKRNIPNHKGDRVKRERDPIPWRYCLLTLFCGLLLVAGFFFAARQHFSVMDFAIKNAKLRREKENLEAEQRRLYLTREISLSPAEIKKIAKKIGLQDLTAQSIEIMRPKKAVEKKIVNETPTKAFLTQETAQKSDKNDKSFEKQAKSTEKSKEVKSKTSASTINERSQIAKK